MYVLMDRTLCVTPTLLPCHAKEMDVVSISIGVSM